MVKRYFKALKK